jgi:hypothetical protein
MRRLRTLPVGPWVADVKIGELRWTLRSVVEHKQTMLVIDRP